MAVVVTDESIRIPVEMYYNPYEAFSYYASESEYIDNRVLWSNNNYNGVLVIPRVKNINLFMDYVGRSLDVIPKGGSATDVTGEYISFLQNFCPAFSQISMRYPRPTTVNRSMVVLPKDLSQVFSDLQCTNDPYNPGNGTIIVKISGTKFVYTYPHHGWIVNANKSSYDNKFGAYPGEVDSAGYVYTEEEKCMGFPQILGHTSGYAALDPLNTRRQSFFYSGFVVTDFSANDDGEYDLDIVRIGLLGRSVYNTSTSAASENGYLTTIYFYERTEYDLNTIEFLKDILRESGTSDGGEESGGFHLQSFLAGLSVGRQLKGWATRREKLL